MVTVFCTTFSGWDESTTKLTLKIHPPTALQSYNMQVLRLFSNNILKNLSIFRIAPSLSGNFAKFLSYGLSKSPLKV